MATFELTSTTADGHIRALSKAILMASRVSREALLEFTPDKMRLCTNSELFLVKFVFQKDFFTDYKSLGRHKCYINLKALQMPFKSSILVADRDSGLRSQIRIKCTVEDEVNNQVVFKIGADPPAATLTYKLSINDLDPDRTAELSAINRKIINPRVEIAPKQTKKERFLLSAFNSFAPDIDQVSIKANQDEIRFIGSSGALLSNNNTTSEFTHSRDDFSQYTVREDVKITIPLRYLKLFLTFVETNRVQMGPKYIFEGMGLPAHFIYDAHLFKGHFVSATPIEYIPEEIDYLDRLPITNGPNDSFIVDDNVIQPEDDDDLEFDPNEYSHLDQNELDEDEEDGYNDNQSFESDLLDGNLEGFDTTVNNTSITTNNNNSIFGAESIRSEITERTYDAEKAREILNLDEDPDEIENVVIQYSSDSSDD